MEILRERGVEFDIVDYLKQPLGRADLERIVERIDVPPADLVRKDPKFKSLGLDPADYTTKAAVVGLLLEHPALMQRPIAERGGTVIMARPKERIEAIL